MYVGILKKIIQVLYLVSTVFSTTKTARLVILQYYKNCKACYTTSSYCLQQTAPNAGAITPQKTTNIS